MSSQTDDYTPLPLKYRPRTWDDVVGQKHAVTVLRNSLKDGRIFPSYIFAGVAGCGKTSAARAFAMALNCYDLQDGSPCLKCDSCSEALIGRNPDIVEIDGPSYSGVQAMRDLRGQTITVAFHFRRVFIIDEVHSLSRDAFQALLKTLEEPPKQVVFIMATTQPESIPATIHSRSIKLDFRRHLEKDIVERLMLIARLENLALPEESAILIARYADGQLRDSITVLDQLAVSKPNQALGVDLVAAELGVVSGTELYSIMEAVLAYDSPALEGAISATLERTTEFGMIVRSMTDWYRDVLRTKAGAASVIRRSQSDVELLERFAVGMTFEQLFSALHICWDLAEKVRFSGTSPKTFFLTGLYRLMLLREAPPLSPPGPPDVITEVVKPQEVTAPVSAFSATNDAGSIASLEEELKRLAQK